MIEIALSLSPKLNLRNNVTLMFWREQFEHIDNQQNQKSWQRKTLKTEIVKLYLCSMEKTQLPNLKNKLLEDKQ